MKIWKVLLLLSFVVCAVQSTPAAEDKANDKKTVDDAVETPQQQDETQQLEDIQDEDESDDGDDEESDEVEEEDENEEEDNAVEESDEDPIRKVKVIFKIKKITKRRCGKKICLKRCKKYRYGKYYKHQCRKHCFKFCKKCTKVCKKRCYRRYYGYKPVVKCGGFRCGKPWCGPKYQVRVKSFHGKKY